MEFNHQRLAVVLASTMSFYAHAGDIRIEVGAFFSQADTSFGVTNPNTGNDYDLDFESDLNMSERETLPYVLVGYDFNESHRVFLDWRSLHRTATNEYVSKPFTIPGSDYEAQVGARIESTLNIDITRLGYAYKFYDGEDWDWESLIGLHIMNLQTGFGGDLGYREDDSVNIVPINTKENSSITAPLPNIGLLGNYRVTDNWYVLGHAQLFGFSVEQVSGLLLDLSIGVEYEFNHQIGLAASYSYYEVNLDYGSDIADIDTKFKFFGPVVTLSYDF